MIQRHDVLAGLTFTASLIGATGAALVIDSVAFQPDEQVGVDVESAVSPAQQLGVAAAADCTGVNFKLPGCLQNPLEQLATTTTSTSTTTDLAERPTPTHASRHEPRLTVTTTTTTVPVPNPPPSATLAEALPADASSGFSSATPEEREYLLCIADEESDFSPTAYNSAGPYYGKYQFHQDTWDGFVPSIGLGDLAGVDIRQVPEEIQDYVALRFLRAGRNGEWGPDPRCSHFLRRPAA